jgi:hypothetical protein
MEQNRLLFTERPRNGSLAPIYGALLFLVSLSVLALIYAALPHLGG